MTQPSTTAPSRPHPLWIGTVTLVLFLIWSNSFIALDELLGRGTGAGPLRWWELVMVRFGLVAVCMAAWLLAARARATLALIRRAWPRLLVIAVLTVPGYNFFLLFAQENGVPPAIASLVTAAVPLFMMILGGLFLGERVGLLKITAFAVAAVGMACIAVSKQLGPASFAYPLLVLCALGAPLCWSIYSTVLKPMLRTESPILVLFTCVAAAGLPLLACIDASLWARLGGRGEGGFGLTEWAYLLYLVGPCTLFGFPVWNWLVKHMSASAVGFTVFLNPPFTFASAYLLQGVPPLPLEVVGAAIVLIGVGIVVVGRASGNRTDKSLAADPGSA